MKKFIFGFLFGASISSVVTDYLVRYDIYYRLTNRNYRERVKRYARGN